MAIGDKHKFLPERWVNSPFGINSDAVAGASTNDGECIVAAYFGPKYANSQTLAMFQQGNEVPMMEMGYRTEKRKIPKKAVDKIVIPVPGTNKGVLIVMNREALEPNLEHSNAYIISEIKETAVRYGTRDAVSFENDLRGEIVQKWAYSHLLESLNIPVVYDWMPWLLEQGYEGQTNGTRDKLVRWLQDAGRTSEAQYMQYRFPLCGPVASQGVAVIRFDNVGTVWEKMISYGLAHNLLDTSVFDN